MSALGHVRIGHKAPDFHCEAVIGGHIQDVSLGTYIRPSTGSSTPDPDAPWLIIMFIPAAFSFVCPTEVLAFQNCLEEFNDRNCSVVFVSVDTKHSLWHWQNVPRQYGGLGQMDIPLLSDANHHIANDYGVLIEEEGVSLRGMFIIDNEGIVQQITLNNLTVGRSVLEALRLLEAFQAVAKHGVLCPIDWKPNSNAADTISTISNTLAESYEERLANLQKEFGGVPVTDLDAKHKNVDWENSNFPNDQKKGDENSLQGNNRTASLGSIRSQSTPPPPFIPEVICDRPQKPSPTSSFKTASQRTTSSPTQTPPISLHSARSSSVPSNDNGMTTPTSKQPSMAGTARHSRGRKSSLHRNVDQGYVNNLFSSNAPSIFQTLIRSFSSTSDEETGHSNASPTPAISPTMTKSHSLPPHKLKHNTFESARGAHVVLEFADPTTRTPMSNPNNHDVLPPTPVDSVGTIPLPPPLVTPHRSHSQQLMTRASAPALSRATSWTGSMTNGWTGKSPAATKKPESNATGSTRLQATFDAIKKMSTGLASPRRTESVKTGMANKSVEEVKTPGYFDVVLEGVEA